jgi:hypothetical protein
MIAMLMCAFVAAADAEPAPKSPPPVILIASIKGDELVSRINQTVAVPFQVTEKVERNGTVEDVVVTKYRIETRTTEQKRDLKKATITTAGGKKLTLEDARKRLEKAQPVVLSSDGNAVDAAYLKVFDKDAIVIVAPLVRPNIVAPPPPPPPPLPKKE